MGIPNRDNGVGKVSFDSKVKHPIRTTDLTLSELRMRLCAVFLEAGEN